MIPFVIPSVPFFNPPLHPPALAAFGDRPAHPASAYGILGSEHRPLIRIASSAALMPSGVDIRQRRRDKIVERTLDGGERN